MSNEKSQQSSAGQPQSPASRIGITEQTQIDGLNKSIDALESALLALQKSHSKLASEHALLLGAHAALCNAFKTHKHVYWVHSQTGSGGELWNSLGQLKAYLNDDQHNLDSWGVYLRQSGAVANQGSRQETDPPE